MTSNSNTQSSRRSNRKGDNTELAGLTAREQFSYLSLGQAVFYVITGLWALVSIRTFQKVTGPKTDIWLVKTVGVLIVVIGGVLGLAGQRRNASPEIPLLAVGSAAGLTAIDIIYVAKRRISPIYLLDAVAEIGLIGLWAVVWPRQRQAD